MTPKKKALELLSKFRRHAKLWDYYNDIPEEEDHVKACALICINEMIKNSNSGCVECGGSEDLDKSFLLKVKKIIEMV
jgi:hypothetical protein